MGYIVEHQRTRSGDRTLEGKLIALSLAGCGFPDWRLVVLSPTCVRLLGDFHAKRTIPFSFDGLEVSLDDELTCAEISGESLHDIFLKFCRNDWPFYYRLIGLDLSRSNLQVPYQPMQEAEFKQTVRKSQRIVPLPCFYSLLTAEEQKQVHDTDDRLWRHMQSYAREYKSNMAKRSRALNLSEDLSQFSSGTPSECAAVLGEIQGNMLSHLAKEVALAEAWNGICVRLGKEDACKNVSKLRNAFSQYLSQLTRCE